MFFKSYVPIGLMDLYSIIAMRKIYFTLFFLLIVAAVLFESNNLSMAADTINNTEFTKSKKVKPTTEVKKPVTSDAYKNIDVAKLFTVTTTDYKQLRNKAINIIFGTNQLPKQLPDSVYETVDRKWAGTKGLKWIEKFVVNQKYNINSEGYIFHPKVPNNEMVLFHEGHGADFIHDQAAIKELVNNGYTVYAMCMPLQGRNLPPPAVHIPNMGILYLGKSHDNLKFLDHPLQYFINPVIVALNHASKQKYKNIYMCGFSGGGWTTTICAGIDTRIKYSFPVAGSLPFYIRFTEPARELGDFEQMYPALFNEVNYLDFYVLGSIGKNRKQVQILNQSDPCCFKGEKATHYEPYVKEVVSKFNNGEYKLVVDTTLKKHIISEYALNIIIDEMGAHQ
jgi:dienelactone hydrolase